MTAPRRTPAGPGSRHQIPDPRIAEAGLSEMREPGDLPFPDDRWPQGAPEYVVVLHQRRDHQPGHPPSLTELLQTGHPRTREPEPDLEAEP